MREALDAGSLRYSFLSTLTTSRPVVPPCDLVALLHAVLEHWRRNLVRKRCGSYGAPDRLVVMIHKTSHAPYACMVNIPPTSPPWRNG